MKQREERDKRKEKKDRKKKWLKTQDAVADAAAPEQAGSKRALEDVSGESGGEGDDWAELAREERLAKRVKKGHLSQSKFDAEFADL